MEGLLLFEGRIPSPSQKKLPIEKKHPQKYFFLFLKLKFMWRVDFPLPFTKVHLEATGDVPTSY